MLSTALAALSLLLPVPAPAEEPERRRPDPKDVEIEVMRLKDPSSTWRVRGARTIGAWGAHARAAVPSLIPLLEDPEAEVRRAAAFALARMGKDAAPAEKALAALLGGKEEDAGARANAARALGAMEAGRNGRAALLKALGDGDPAVRVNAAGALADLGAADGAAVAPLARALRDDDWTVRAAAARALGVPKERNRAAVPHLARALLDDVETVRAMAARALGRIAEEPKTGEAALLKALEAEFARATAPPAEEAKPPEDAVLRERLAKEGGARRNMAWALGRYQANTRDVRALLRRMEEKDPAAVVRSAARTALDRIDITVMPAALEEAPREVAAVPNLPWRMDIAGGCVEVVFRYEK